jgi:hypothetical protein
MRSETLCETSSPIGGIAGKTYPGNFDLDALKKTNVKAMQHAKYRPGDIRQLPAPSGRRKSLERIASIGVQGRSAKSIIGA